MMKLFSRYLSVGVINTLLHWLIFAMLYSLGSTQSWANLAAFCVAVTFSFFANARWTFKADATTPRYLLYIFFMGAMAAGVGRLADWLHANPLITLISFSAVSLVSGFIYSHFVVFRIKK